MIYIDPLLDLRIFFRFLYFKISVQLLHLFVLQLCIGTKNDNTNENVIIRAKEGILKFNQNKGN